MDQEKLERIKSLDPNDWGISPQNGVCRFEPGEDALVRRAKEEKVAEAQQARQGCPDIDGLVPAQPVEHDGEYVATRRDGNALLHCIAWRDHGRWKRMSPWSEQMPESARRQAEVAFVPQQGLPHAGRPAV